MTGKKASTKKASTKSDKSKPEDKSKKAPSEDKKGGGLKIETLEPEVTGARVRPNVRMWLTADRKKLVPEGHKDAATLYCNGNNFVPKEEYDKLKKVGFK